LSSIQYAALSLASEEITPFVARGSKRVSESAYLIEPFSRTGKVQEVPEITIDLLDNGIVKGPLLDNYLHPKLFSQRFFTAL
jgi:hypothetical protein